MECPGCGSSEIISDLFEDELLSWCTYCGREVPDEEEEEEEEEDLDGYREEYEQAFGDEAEGKHSGHKVPSIRGGKV